ncbi:MAG: DUF1905 domain-containing protein [Phycisphaerales bacterium]|nr:DUF1905 domain-containing protein [Phycisphaerales bacterium]
MKNQSTRASRRPRKGGAITCVAVLRVPRAEAGKRPTWAFLVLPAEASAGLPSRGQVSASGTVNGAKFRATLEPDGRGGHWMKVSRVLRLRAGAEPGDSVRVELTPASDEPEPRVPADFRRALAAAGARVQAAWRGITPAARRDFVHWVTSPKRADTRATRIEVACDMLANGKRRPCCFDRSGMYSGSISCPLAEGEGRS